MLFLMTLFQSVTAWPTTDDALKEVAEFSVVLEHEDQYIPVGVKKQFKQIIEHPQEIKPKLYLRLEYERILK